MSLSSYLGIALGLLAAGSSAINNSSIRTPHSPLYTTSVYDSSTIIASEELVPSSSLITLYSDTTVASTTTGTLRETIPGSTYTVIAWYNVSSTVVASTRTATLPPLRETSFFTSTLSSVIPISTTVTTDVPSVTYVPSTTITPPPNPCPTTCTISAGTVNLFYWPSNGTYTYPSTYFDEHLDYVFTSPSVYMVINTIYGYNTAGRVGPSGTSVVFPLDLDQVSTIVPTVSATRQLTLNDLGTDCPQSEDPSVIATAAPDGRCDPILAAPEPVKSWASPCNACGNFGLFDPPYAVPTVTGGLVPTSTTSTTQSEVQSTSTVITTTEDSTSSDEGTTLVPESTTSTLSDATESESYTQSSTSISSVLTATESYVSSSSNTALVSGPTPSPSWSASPSNTPIMTASATKSTGSIFLFALSLLISACLI